MKNLILLFILLICSLNVYPAPKDPVNNHKSLTGMREQVQFSPNNISTWIQNTGIFNQDISNGNDAGFEWPAGTNKFAIFTSGVSIAAIMGNQIRMAAASYSGEYFPGMMLNGSPYTDSAFKFYKITFGDDPATNNDWNNWGRMVQYGAPYIDVNLNGIYEPNIDTPGVKGAYETIFICYTDGFPENHTTSEGMPGGTYPLGADISMTAWGYNSKNISYPYIDDIQFFKYVIKNHNDSAWNKVRISIYADIDIGDVSDDYLGCDSNLNLGYGYNADNFDGDGSFQTYGISPPAVGFKFLNHEMSSYVQVSRSGGGGVECEREPGVLYQTYNFMKGYKRDSSRWIDPVTNVTTKFVYPGDPETNTGWTQQQGSINNCGGALTGELIAPGPPSDKKFIMSIGDDDLNINPDGTIYLYTAQVIAKGTNNLNSVTKLKITAQSAQNFYNENFSVGVVPVGSGIPSLYTLYQNYPNPFNPTTKIKFDIPAASKVTLKIYDISGKEIATLVNEKLSAGGYEAEWNAASFASGVYFYRLETESFSQMKKMILIK